MHSLGFRWTLFAALAVALVPASAEAEPTGPAAFCEAYPDAPACAVSLPTCAYCHVSTDPETPTWNPYGDDLADALDGLEFDALEAALAEVAELDSDGDGFSNEEEIEAGTRPGDSASAPAVAMCPEDGDETLLYRVCEYDPRYAYRKVHLDFCGRQPSFDDYEAFAALDPDAQATAIDDTLRDCLDSEFWGGKDGVLWQLAYAKVRPVHALKGGRDPSPIEQLRIADYDHDLALFAYTQMDDNDARDVLLADYYVEQEGTSFTTVDNFSESLQACTEDSDCPDTEQCYADQCRCTGCIEGVVTDRRQGLLTTRWVALYSTMFSALPRNTAAQAYRAFLGFDIAKQEGLYPVGVPEDFDNKGVDAEECAICHSTLDSLSYPFSTYQGFGPNRASYYPERMQDGFFAHEGPNIGDTPEAGHILGQSVADLGEWADVAANSDAFARATVAQYWRLTMGRDPQPDETETFTTLWEDFRDVHDYRVEPMLRDLVRTEAYGAP